MIALFLEALTGYAAFFPFLLLLQIIMNRRCRKEQLQVRRGAWVLWQLFAFMVVEILSVTGSAGILDVGTMGAAMFGPRELNLVPFFMPGAQATRLGLVLNTILFMPVGFFLPLLWKRCEHFGRLLGLGFALSLWVELSQLLNWRITDIDDLIANTLGAVIGWLLYRLAGRRLAPAFQLDNTQAGFWVRHYALVSLGGICLYNFFVRPFISLGLYSLTGGGVLL